MSPILQGSLGNLCPLYIIAGDGEVLRDEIVYFAHRAAHPDEYPVRQGVLMEGRRQKENVEKFTTPTKVATLSARRVYLLTLSFIALQVHLQVYDGKNPRHPEVVFDMLTADHASGMPHVLTVFIFTDCVCLINFFCAVLCLYS